MRPWQGTAYGDVVALLALRMGLQAGADPGAWLPAWDPHFDPCGSPSCDRGMCLWEGITCRRAPAQPRIPGNLG